MRLRRSTYILEEETGENNICQVVERKLNRRKNRRGGGRKSEQLVYGVCDGGRGRGYAADKEVK